MKTSTLIVVDMQNDFCPGGALPVPDGHNIIPIVNRYIEIFNHKKLPIFFSRDWHPPKTKHFSEFGGQWPIHCVQDTIGAELVKDLIVPINSKTIFKGQSKKLDDYSVFSGKSTSNLTLSRMLNALHIDILYICGLATDYCVKETVLDALKSGWNVNLLLDAIAGVNINQTDSLKAIDEMMDFGAKPVIINELSL